MATQIDDVITINGKEAIRSEIVLTWENAEFLNGLLDKLVDVSEETTGKDIGWHMDLMLDIIFSNLRRHPEKFVEMFREEFPVKESAE